MKKEICESCKCKFDPEKAIEEFDAEYGDGSYMYHFQWNSFCADCAKSIYEDDDDDYDSPPPGCRECGGDWPNCTTSCPMYDD